jgi:hypothetical protein
MQNTISTLFESIDILDNNFCDILDFGVDALGVPNS